RRARGRARAAPRSGPRNRRRSPWSWVSVRGWWTVQRPLPHPSFGAVAREAQTLGPGSRSAPTTPRPRKGGSPVNSTGAAPMTREGGAKGAVKRRHAGSTSPCGPPAPDLTDEDQHCERQQAGPLEGGRKRGHPDPRGNGGWPAGEHAQNRDGLDEVEHAGDEPEPGDRLGAKALADAQESQPGDQKCRVDDDESAIRRREHPVGRTPVVPQPLERRQSV